MSEITAIFAVTAFVGLQAWNEYLFYGINKAAGFALKSNDVKRKANNAALFVLALLLIPVSLAPVMLVSRWIAVDLAVNIAANRPLFETRYNDRSVVDRVAFQINKFIPVWGLKFVMLLAAVLFAL